MVNEPTIKDLLDAVRQGDLEVVEWVLEAGVPANADDRGWTALHLAAEDGADAIAELLVANGADVDAFVAGSHCGSAPLHRAAANDHGSTVTLLLRHGAAAAPIDDNGRTPLHVAAREHAASAVRALMQHDPALATRTDRAGRTPEQDAVDGDDDALALLLRT